MDALLVTPLGALSVIICAILSAIFLKERLSFVGKVGCFLCLVGSVIIALNAPEQSAAANIQEMQGYVISPGFLTYAGVIILGCAFIALWAAPRYGKKSMLVYLSVCSLIGGLSVVATQGLGAALVAQIGGQQTDQFKQWFLYVLFVFVIATLVTEIIYLNKALNIFNAALVTPTYYVYFTSATIVTSAILFRGFKGTAISITTMILAFLQICAGVVLLQLSKSAKDVPDSAVFKGDLDQVRTIAEQEDPESEPKADSIRGGAALIRSLSKTRMRREASDATKIARERLEPIGENETVEWDGIRRRKTVRDPNAPTATGAGPSRAVHYPLGLTYFPSEDGDSYKEATDLTQNIGLFSRFKTGAQSVIHPHRRPSNRSVSYASHNSQPSHVALSDMSRVQRNLSDAKSARYSSVRDEDMPHVSGMPPGLEHDDTSYRGATIDHSPTPPPHGGGAAAKRQFSFQKVFGRKDKLDVHPPEDEYRPSTSGTGRSSIMPSIKSPKLGLITEEERLGLVKGDGSGPSSVNSRHAGGGPHPSEERVDSSDEESESEGSVRRKPSRRNSDDTWHDRYDDEDSDFDDGVEQHRRGADAGASGMAFI